MNRLFTVGLSHRTAPVELRECVDFSRGVAGAELAALSERAFSRVMVVLSTCNRGDIYAVAGP
jgi:glutamyl-tRNA reductase